MYKVDLNPVIPGAFQSQWMTAQLDHPLAAREIPRDCW